MTTPAVQPAATFQPPAPLRFDRRAAPRYQMGGRVTVLRRGHAIDCYHQPVRSVQMHDLSDSGMAAECDAPLAPDEPVAVFFPPRGPQKGLDLLGHVVRCTPMAHGYRMAIQFDRLPAA